MKECGYSIQLKFEATDNYRNEKVGFVQVKAADGTVLFYRKDYQNNPHYRAKEKKLADFKTQFNAAVEKRSQN